MAGAVNLAWVASTSPSLRIRDDLGLFFALRRMAAAFGIELLEVAPTLWSLPLDRDRGDELLRFVVHALGIHTLFGFALGALVVLAFGIARSRSTAAARWLSTDSGGRFAIASAAALGAIPSTYPFVRAALLDYPFWLKPVVWAALAAALLAPLAIITRSQRAAERSTLGLAWVALGIVGAGGGALLLASAEDRRPPAGDSAHPNVLLVSIDSLRRDHLSSYGYERQTSPMIDRLAQDGVRFDVVVAPTTWTLPSHVTLLTGLAPAQHGVTNHDRRLAMVATTLAEAMRAAGYDTAAWVSGPYLETRYGYAQGFDHYDDYSFVGRTPNASRVQITSDRIVDRVTDWLGDWDAAGQKRPFFLFLHLWDVHHDFNPPPPYDQLFDPDYRGEITGLDFGYGDDVHAGMDSRDLAHVVALYDGEIRFTDDQLARLFATIGRMGVLDDTIIVVTADHGEEFFEHGHKGHLNNLFDESLLVPLVIRFPARLPQGHVVRDQVRLMDVASTLLDLSAVPVPEGFGEAPDGSRAVASTLMPLMLSTTRGDPPERPAFADLVGALAAVRTDRYKLIRPLDGTGPEQLFDLVSDPGETRNIADESPEVRAELSRWLDDWRARAENDSSAFSRASELSREHSDHLRALGYVE